MTETNKNLKSASNTRELKRLARTWHALTPQEALATLQSRESGLSREEVVTLRARFGANTLPEEKSRTLFDRFLAQLNSMLIYVLLGSAAITAVLGHAITRFAIFLATGHAGSVRAPGWEPEELASWALPPRG